MQSTYMCYIRILFSLLTQCLGRPKCQLRFYVLLLQPPVRIFRFVNPPKFHPLQCFVIHCSDVSDMSRNMELQAAFHLLVLVLYVHYRLTLLFVQLSRYERTSSEIWMKDHLENNWNFRYLLGKTDAGNKEGHWVFRPLYSWYN